MRKIRDWMREQPYRYNDITYFYESELNNDGLIIVENEMLVEGINTPKICSPGDDLLHCIHMLHAEHNKEAVDPSFYFKTKKESKYESLFEYLSPKIKCQEIIYNASNTPEKGH